MSNLTDLYMNGANALNDFFGMLHLAILDRMPGATISGDAAWGWRGYRIDSYEDLAKGLYYLQIYTDHPETLIFQEGYKYPQYKPIDKRDVAHGIKSGSYYYPFEVTLDLYRSRFFLLKASEQYGILQNFVSYASSQALLWQRSETRARPEITSQQYLEGIKPAISKPIPPPARYEQVSMDYLGILSSQNELFKKLKTAVSSALGGKYKWFRPNSQWTNWDFRGYRLKLTPEASPVQLWQIPFDKPENLNYYPSRNSGEGPRAYFDIRSTRYFDQSDEQQNALLAEFVNNTLGEITP